MVTWVGLAVSSNSTFGAMFCLVNKGWKLGLMLRWNGMKLSWFFNRYKFLLQSNLKNQYPNLNTKIVTNVFYQLPLNGIKNGAMKNLHYVDKWIVYVGDSCAVRQWSKFLQLKNEASVLEENIARLRRIC